MTGGAELTPVKRALVEIRRLKEENRALRQKQAEPIAIVGAGLRFPGGADSLDSFWNLLLEGRDAISRTPPDRWDVDAIFDPDPDAPGRSYATEGGFVRDVYDFDPEFFGIARREALSIDPQQRLFLETAWKALEDAAIPPHSLREGSGGVFLGIGTGDYGRMLMAELEGIDEYTTVGTTYSVAAGRLAYLLGLHGPALSVDTACSSSLVAIHLACQSLRAEESEIALAGGVNLILSPELTVNFCRARMLAPDGRCKTFDAAADGYVRSEGCGVVVLKRLSDAQRDGDRIIAVIRGSAVNQDGRSSGLTAPNGVAQASVIRRALRSAGLRPEDVSYVEAHGTGTSLGDPIEVGALGEVFASDEREDPLWVGSVKTNMGHLEAAAGVAGLLKAALCVRERQAPPHIHFEKPNPHIEWDRTPVHIPVEPTRLGRPSESCRAGVSSFGLSGTNAHIVLESPPESSDAPARPEPPTNVLTLSAPTEIDLGRVVASMSDFLAKSEESFAAICATANAGRTHLAHRLAVIAPDAAAARQELERWMAGEASTVIHGNALAGAAPATLFLFVEEERARPDVTEALRWLEGATGAEGSERRSPVAAQVALAEAWTALGVRADEAHGLGEGELAATVFRGESSLDEAEALVREGGQADAARRRQGGTPAALGEIIVEGRYTHVVCLGDADEVLARLEVSERDAEPVWISPVGSTDAWTGFLEAVARLHVSGHELDWRYLHGPRRPAVLPSYPFAHSTMRHPAAETRRHRTDAPPAGPDGAAITEPVAGPGSYAASEIVERLRDAVGSEAEEIATGVVRDCVMQVLRSDPDRPPALDARLMELGLDSLMAVRLRNALQTTLGLPDELPATLVFDYPTIREIGGFVVEIATGAPQPGDRARHADQEPERSSAAPMAESEIRDLSEEEAEALLVQRLIEEEGA